MHWKLFDSASPPYPSMSIHGQEPTEQSCHQTSRHQVRHHYQNPARLRPFLRIHSRHPIFSISFAYRPFDYAAIALMSRARALWSRRCVVYSARSSWEVSNSGRLGIRCYGRRCRNKHHQWQRVAMILGCIYPRTLRSIAWQPWGLGCRTDPWAIAAETCTKLEDICQTRFSCTSRALKEYKPLFQDDGEALTILDKPLVVTMYRAWTKPYRCLADFSIVSRISSSQSRSKTSVTRSSAYW